jgi:hypothetical protein
MTDLPYIFTDNEFEPSIPTRVGQSTIGAATANARMFKLAMKRIVILQTTSLYDPPNLPAHIPLGNLADGLLQDRIALCRGCDVETVQLWCEGLGIGNLVFDCIEGNTATVFLHWTPM